MKTILFQGDSITDAERARSNDYNLGYGYPDLVSAQLGYEQPQEYRFLNRGVGGNRVVDLYARMKVDILNLKPDILSIHIGVNDVWHELDFGNGVPADKYFKVYDLLISEIKEALPDTKIMILEPFVMEGSDTKRYYDAFRPEVELRAQKARQIAEKHGLVFIPLQEKFEEAAKIAPSDYWLRDGVHPLAPGHEIIKRAWLEGFSKLK